MSFVELNKASDVAAAHMPVPSTCSPYHWPLWASLTPQLWGEARQQAGLGREPNHLGKTTKSPQHRVLSYVPNLVSFWKRKQHNLTAASDSQTSPWLCRARNTDISACTSPPLKHGLNGTVAQVHSYFPKEKPLQCHTQKANWGDIFLLQQLYPL